MQTLVLIHGAYQGGWIWKLTAASLRAAGHQAFAPTLDGCAERAHQLRPGISNDSHAREVADWLHYEDLRDVVLVGTSSGGMVVTRVAELARERIARVVFADALALLDGECLGDIVTRVNPRNTELGTGPTREDARDRLFAELEEPHKTWALDRFTMHPRAVMEDPVSLESFWQDSWDATVIWCRRSVNPPEAHQRRAAATLNARWFELDAGHYPMLQVPDALAEFILAT
ncbi:MAG: alpha/beta hydrolase [Pseudomonadota bacterium]